MDPQRYRGKAIVVTGGTRGIGLETALTFARFGASAYVTCFMGSADERAVAARFESIGAVPPVIVRCNAGDPEETRALIERIGRDFERIEAWIANVSVAQLVKGFDAYRRRSLLQSIEMSAWPMIDALLATRAVLGAYPRYVVGLSSVGAERYVHNYDFMAASKSVMEILCKYATCRLAGEDVRINIVRAGIVDSSSLRLTFGEAFVDWAREFGITDQFLSPAEVAETIYGLCSGFMDAVRGEVIRVDKGAAFFDPFMRKYSDMQRAF